MTHAPTARARALGEAAAVLLTGCAFLVYRAASGGLLPFVVGCSVAWLAYVVFRMVREPGLLREWGLRLDNLWAASRPCLAVLGPAALALMGFGLSRGRAPLLSHLLAALALYPLWALVQQFLVQALFAANLRRLGLPRGAVIVAAALLFGLVHAPDWMLVGLCAAAGAVWTALFLRTPNLIPLALAHGWLGALAYYIVLGRDVWAELTGGLQ